MFCCNDYRFAVDENIDRVIDETIVSTAIPLRSQDANLSIPSCFALETFLNQKCSKCNKHSITFFQSKRFNCSQSGRLKSNSYLWIYQDVGILPSEIRRDGS